MRFLLAHGPLGASKGRPVAAESTSGPPHPAARALG